MQHEITYRPTFAQLKVLLARGETIRAEAGAMLGHSEGIEVETGTRGGFVQSLKRSVFGGESFFLNDFTAREPGSVTFAPRLPGDVIPREITSEPLFVQSSSFLAGTPGVELDTKFGGFKSFFAGEGLFLLRLTGSGTAFLSSFGAIDEIRLAPGERYTVDTGHVVAFEASMPYSVRRVGGLTSTLLSGEGLVVEFEGPGTLWTQSRSPDAFLSWIASNISQGGAVVPVAPSSDSTRAVGGDSPGGNPRGPAQGPRDADGVRRASGPEGGSPSRPNGGGASGGNRLGRFGSRWSGGRKSRSGGRKSGSGRRTSASGNRTPRSGGKSGSGGKPGGGRKSGGGKSGRGR